LIKNLFLLLSCRQIVFFFLLISAFVLFSILDIVGLYFFSLGVSGILDINNFKWCDIHKMKPLIYNEEKILHCKLCDKKSLIKLCKGKSHKEEPCTFKALEGDEYCKLHQNYKKC
jgi:hypothetical protein